jgi:hypothetical protein
MYLEEEVISQPSCELAALWNPILREEKMEIVRERNPKIREQVGNTERSKKRGREMKKEPAEMERGKKARTGLGYKDKQLQELELQSVSTISELLGDVRVDILSLMMGTSISVSETSLVFNLF